MVAEPPEAVPAQAPPSQAGQSTTRRVLGGALMLLSTQPITWASSLLLTIFIPRLLDSRSLGEFTIAVTLAALVGEVVSLGVPTVLTRRIAAQPATATADITSALVLLVGLGTVVALIAPMVIAATGLLSVSAALLGVVFAGMVVTQGRSILSAALIGYQWMGRFAWSNALVTVLVAVLSIGLLALGGGAIGLAAANVVPLLVVAVGGWLWFGIGFDRAGLDRRALVQLASLGLPFLAWNVLVRFRSDGEALFLGALLSVEAVGWWSAALRVVSIPIFVPTLIVTPLLPALSQIVGDREAFASTLRRGFELTLVVTVGASAAIFAFAPIVPSILGWSPEYEAAVPLMQVLIFFFPLLSMGMVFGTGLIALGDERRLLLANVGATVVQYGLLWLAVPIATSWFGNGALGAAFSRVASEVVMIVAAQMLLPRGIMTLGTWLFAGRVLLAGGVLILVSMPLLNLFWPLAAVVGGLGYLAALFLLRAARPSDVIEALGWVQARLRRWRGAA